MQSPPSSVLRFGAIAALVYALMLMPALVHASFDPSVFIVAGDHFVSADHSPSPILVRRHSFGYDGQFYYAMALDPLVPAVAVDGITFDHPVWRWQRIFYPLLSSALALGNARALPAIMLGINLLCIAALGMLARFALRLWPGARLPAWTLILWPGFMTTLTHDTTELLACACLLGAAMAWLQGRLLPFAILGACATLTRETSSLMLAAVCLVTMAQGLARDKPARLSAKPALYAAATLLPVVAWHFWLAHLWHDAAQAAPVQANLGLPFVGVAQRLAASIGTAFFTPGIGGNARLMAVYVAATAACIIAFSVWVATYLPALMRRGEAEAALGAGWLCMVALIFTLSARGPWIDPTAIFRAFSECGVIGWLILLRSGARARVAGAAILPLAIMNWHVCLVDLH